MTTEIWSARTPGDLGAGGYTGGKQRGESRDHNSQAQEELRTPHAHHLLRQ